MGQEIPHTSWSRLKNAIPPEQVLCHHCDKRRGREGGTGTVPSFIVTVLRISSHCKRNSPERFFWLTCVPCIHLHPVVASRALYRNRFACPLQAGKPWTKVYPCMVAAMADHKAAWKFHTRFHGITGISTRPGRRVKVSGLLKDLLLFRMRPHWPDMHRTDYFIRWMVGKRTWCAAGQWSPGWRVSMNILGIYCLSFMFLGVSSHWRSPDGRLV